MTNLINALLWAIQSFSDAAEVLWQDLLTLQGFDIQRLQFSHMSYKDMNKLSGDWEAKVMVWIFGTVWTIQGQSL